MKFRNGKLLNVSIHSNRLLLIPISMKFKEEIFKEFTEEITTFMYPAAATDISEIDEFIKKSLAGLEDGSNLQLVILDKETREFFGCLGLHHVDRKTPEFGIWLKKSAHGKGYGREGVTVLKKWADDNLDYEYILYPVAEKNIPSRKIPESLGGIIENETDEVGLGGNKFHCLEYRIYPTK